jgi:hypothetical protein
VEFHKVSIATTKAEEKVTLKAINKLKLTFYKKSFEEGTLKALAQQSKSMWPSKQTSQLALNWSLGLYVVTCIHNGH